MCLGSWKGFVIQIYTLLIVSETIILLASVDIGFIAKSHEILVSFIFFCAYLVRINFIFAQSGIRPQEMMLSHHNKWY